MRLVNHSAGIIPGMTHFQPQRDASQREDEGEGKETEARLCSPCGGEFRPTRDWQKQCSPRCRQRAYVQRRAEAGARDSVLLRVSELTVANAAQLRKFVGKK